MGCYMPIGKELPNQGTHNDLPVLFCTLYFTCMRFGIAMHQSCTIHATIIPSLGLYPYFKCNFFAHVCSLDYIRQCANFTQQIAASKETFRRAACLCEVHHFLYSDKNRFDQYFYNLKTWSQIYINKLFY
jgi:hypothetical protein